MKKLPIVASAIVITLLGGCALPQPETWVNKGPVTIDASKTGLIYCHEDANIIDGERMVGTLCATPTSGFFMKGEPEIKFGPWNRKFMAALVSETTSGVERDFKGKRVFLKCAPITGADNTTEVGRDCTVSMNDQQLVSAKFMFKN